MRTPGPAPPPSWVSGGGLYRQALQAGYYAARPAPRRFGKRTTVTRSAPEKLARFLDMMGDHPVQLGSLMHIALRTAAKNWDAISEDCFESLDYLPVHLRVVLLSYLTTYGPEEGLDMESLQALFPNHADITCLDLSGLAGWGFTIKELRRWLTKPVIETASISNENRNPNEDIMESWEDVAMYETISPSIPPTLNTATPFLAKLSLAYPPQNISWSDLLSLSKDLHTLTHLSLAHWPLPTRTPNMKSASYVSSSGAEFSASGTPLYSSTLDKDFQESAMILRQLSEQTYSLHWLDLSGCNDWLSALTSAIPPPSAPAPDLSLPPASINARDTEWETQQYQPRGPDWTRAWRNITYLNLSQPSSHRLPPSDLLRSKAFKLRLVHRYRSLAHTHLAILQEYASAPAQVGREASTSPECTTCDVRAGYCVPACRSCEAYLENAAVVVARWLEREGQARGVGRAINRVRIGSGGERCVFDHGWMRGDGYR